MNAMPGGMYGVDYLLGENNGAENMGNLDANALYDIKNRPV